MKINKAAVKRTLCATNRVHGKGEVMGVVWGMDAETLFHGGDYRNCGMVVRQHRHGMDAVEFHLLDSNTLKFLRKVRVIV